jgi:hypothetical protein
MVCRALCGPLKQSSAVCSTRALPGLTASSLGAAHGHRPDWTHTHARTHAHIHTNTHLQPCPSAQGRWKLREHEGTLQPSEAPLRPHTLQRRPRARRTSRPTLRRRWCTSTEICVLASLCVWVCVWVCVRVCVCACMCVCVHMGMECAVSVASLLPLQPRCPAAAVWHCHKVPSQPGMHMHQRGLPASQHHDVVATTTIPPPPPTHTPPTPADGASCVCHTHLRAPQRALVVHVHRLIALYRRVEWTLEAAQAVAGPGCAAATERARRSGALHARVCCVVARCWRRRCVWHRHGASGRAAGEAGGLHKMAASPTPRAHTNHPARHDRCCEVISSRHCWRGGECEACAALLSPP